MTLTWKESKENPRAACMDLEQPKSLTPLTPSVLLWSRQRSPLLKTRQVKIILDSTVNSVEVSLDKNTRCRHSVLDFFQTRRSCKGRQGCLGKVTGGEWKEEATVLLDGGNPRGNYSQVLKNFLIKSHGDILFTEKRSLSKYKRRINVHLWTSFNLKHKQVLFDAKLTLCVYLHAHTHITYRRVYNT